MTHQSTRILLGFCLPFGFCARAITYKSPLLDHQAWRQADTASIARNFDRERFNLLYPQVEERGGQATGYVETGLELFAFMVAAIAKVIGFHYEIGRLLSAVIFLASELLVWRFVVRRYGTRAAVASAFLYAFGFPLQLFIERAFMNEALLVCLSLLCFVAAQAYLRTPRAAHLAILLGGSALIGAVKLPYLIVWAPITGLFLEVRGARACRAWELWLMMAVDMTVALAWYLHAHQLARMTGLSFGMFDKLFDPGVVFSTSFLWGIVGRLFKDVLGPIGFVGVAGGLWFSMPGRRWYELFGLAAFVAYLLLVARGNDIHDYYQLAIMPVAATLAGFGIVHIIDMLAVDHSRRRTMLAAALGIAAFATFVRSVSAHSWYEFAESDVNLCSSLAAVTSPAERVVFVGDNDPRWLFCIDRKGWLLSLPEADVTHVRAALNQGATVAIISDSLRDPSVREFFADSGSPVMKTSQVEVVRVR